MNAGMGMGSATQGFGFALPSPAASLPPGSATPTDAASAEVMKGRFAALLAAVEFGSEEAPRGDDAALAAEAAPDGITEPGTKLPQGSASNAAPYEAYESAELARLRDWIVEMVEPQTPATPSREVLDSESVLRALIEAPPHTESDPDSAPKSAAGLAAMPMPTSGWLEAPKESMAFNSASNTASRSASNSASASRAVRDTAVAIRDLDALHPELKIRVERVVTRMQQEFGHSVEVVETIRSQARQNSLYAQGRTAPGAMVTWTRESLHQHGKAADLQVDGSWSNPEAYARLQQVAEEEGLTTLGARDGGHVEWRGAEDGEANRSATRSARSDVASASSAPQLARPTGVAQVAQVAQVARVAQVAQVASVVGTQRKAAATTPAATSAAATAVQTPATHTPATHTAVAQTPVTQTPVATTPLASSPTAAALSATTPAPIAGAVIAPSQRSVGPAQFEPSEDASRQADAPRSTDSSRAVDSPRVTNNTAASAQFAKPSDSATSARADRERSEPFAAASQTDSATAATPAVPVAPTPATGLAVEVPVAASTQPKDESLAASTQAERIEHIDTLDDTRRQQPMQSITLRVEDAQGQDHRVRVDLRGSEVHADITAASGAQARAISDALPELRQRLGAQGLETAGVQVRTWLTDNPTSGERSAPQRDGQQQQKQDQQQQQSHRDPRQSHQSPRPSYDAEGESV